MPLDQTEHRFVRLIFLASVLLCGIAVLHNAQVVLADPSRSVLVYWCATLFILVASVFALAWSWQDITISLIVFGWSGLLSVTTMAIYDACVIGAEWSPLVYAPPVIGVWLMTRFVSGRPAVIYVVAVSVAAIVEGLLFCDSIHTVMAICLTWFVLISTWCDNMRFGRLDREIQHTRGEFFKLQDYVKKEAESEI